LVLQFVGEASELSEALHGGRQKWKKQRIGNAEEAGAHPVHDGFGGVRVSLALGIRLQWNEHQGLVRCTAAEAEARDRENPFHFGDILENLLNLLADALRILERRARRRLHRNDEIALVFVGHKPLGHELENQIANTKTAQDKPGG